MAYWVYENWRAHGHRATVHEADCSHCRNGEGQRGGTRADNGKWHGPYNWLEVAERVAESIPGEYRHCQVCLRTRVASQ
jgi:hypothetical protein